MTVTIASAPSGAVVSTLYAVTVNGSPVPVYTTPVGHYCNFQTDESTTIVVDYNATITSHYIGGGRKDNPHLDDLAGIGTVNGDDLTFVLSDARKNGYYVVEFNNNWLTEEDVNKVPLCIFANAIETGTPSQADPDVIYLTPGWWYVANGTTISAGSASSTPANTYFSIEQGKTLYIADGAILKGKVRIGSDSTGGTGVTAANIKGYGIIDARAIVSPDGGRTLRVNHSSGVTVDGPTFVGMRHWCVVSRKSNNCTFKNLKVLNSRESGVGTPDGFDMIGSSNISIQNFFSRAYDDCCTIKSDMPGGGWAADVTEVHYLGGVVYNAWGGNALEVGYEIPNPLTNCSYKNIVVCRKMSRSDGPTTRDALSIHHTGAGAVDGITFENIRVDATDKHFIGIRTTSTGDLTDVLVKNVVFRQAAKDLPIAVEGVSGGTITGVTFENLQFSDDTDVTSSADVTLQTNAFASGITFIGASTNVLKVKNSTDTNLDRKAFLRFDVSGHGLSAVTTATLRMYCSATDGTATIYVYPVTNDSWTDEITWGTAPGNGDPITSVSVTAPGWYEWPITTFVNEQLAGDGKVSLMLYSSVVQDILVTFESNEAATNKPELVLVP